MSRLPHKPPGAIQTNARGENTDGHPADAPGAASEAQLSLGWRVCMVVWACGFGSLFLYEVGGLLLRIGKGMFGNTP